MDGVNREYAGFYIWVDTYANRLREYGTMGSTSKSVSSLAAGGVLIALASIAGCDSSRDARAAAKEPSAARAATPTVGMVPVTASAAVAEAAAHPTQAVPAASKLADDTLCEAGETPFFFCDLGAKRVSVCGGGSGAVYRYGTPGKVELTSRNLTFANRGYSGGGESQITAKNGEYTYTVYDSTVRTRFGDSGNDPELSSGLVVSRGKRPISSKVCKGKSSITGDAAHVIPAGNFADN